MRRSGAGSARPAGSAARAATGSSSAYDGSASCPGRPTACGSRSSSPRSRYADETRPLPAAAGLLRRAAGPHRRTPWSASGDDEELRPRVRLRRAARPRCRWRCWLRGLRGARLEHRPRAAGLPPPARARPRPRGALDAVLRRAVQLLGRLRRGLADEGVPQGHPRREPRHRDPPGPHRGRIHARRRALRLARPRRRGRPTPPSSWPCSSSSSARPATAGTWPWPACATCSPRPTCTPTRSAATSPARPPGSASRSPRCTPTWPSTSPSSGATARRSTPWPRRWRDGSTPPSTSSPPWPRTRRCCGRRSRGSVTSTAVEVQQVHGDLHLGQTLRTARGWKIVDFEGEPAKPLADRLQPDSVWRDVAGMIRSFDYAPRVVAMTGVGFDLGAEAEQRAYRASEWAARNRAAFLDAYAAQRGEDLGSTARTLLDAYLADKVVYEAVYEARNRPGWLSIPLAALGETHMSDKTDTHAPGELDLHLIGEGRHEELWTVLGAQVTDSRHVVPGLGPQRPGGPGRRRVGRLGRLRAPDDPARRLRRLARPRRGRRCRLPVQVPPPRRRRAVGRPRRPARPVRREAAELGLARVALRAPVGRRRLAGGPAHQPPGRRGDVDLRGAPGLVAQALLRRRSTPGTRSPTRSCPTSPTSASPTWSSCR